MKVVAAVAKVKTDIITINAPDDWDSMDSDSKYKYIEDSYIDENYFLEKEEKDFQVVDWGIEADNI